MKNPFRYKSFTWCAIMIMVACSAVVGFAMDALYHSSQKVIIKTSGGFSDKNGPIISSMEVVKGDRVHIAKTFAKYFNIEISTTSMQVGGCICGENDREIHLREYIHPFEEMCIHQNGKVDIISPHSSIPKEYLQQLAAEIYRGP